MRVPGEHEQIEAWGVDRPIGIVGAGSIGVAWSIVFARARRHVLLFDPDADRRSQAVREISDRLRALGETGLIAERSATVARRVELCATLDGTLGDVSYIQECAPEELELKRSLFSELDRLAPADAILASSSSALCASQFATGLAGAARCLVAHPGNPPYLLPVVELVPGPATDPAVVDRAEALLAAVGMSPVRLRHEVEGFVFNRLQGAVLREAYRLVDDGVVAAQDIDRVMREGLGRRWSIIGPFETAELNSRGGIEAHARRLGPAYARMARDEHPPALWSDELVATVSNALQDRLPRRQWDRNVQWRDRALMLLEKFRRDNPIIEGPGLIAGSLASSEDARATTSTQLPGTGSGR
ncbi:MAG: 3-hydroxyacyl-CoA dehydrogenase [Acidimicrobiales bacterium]